MTAFDTTRRAAGERPPIAVEAEPRPDRREQERPRLLGLTGVGFAVVVAAGMAVAVLPVAQNSSATTAGQEVRALERRRSDLQASIYNMQNDVAQLGSLARIDREARERLGMVPANRSVIVQVPEVGPAQRDVPARYLPVETGTPTPPARRSPLDAILSRLSLR